MLLFLLFGTKGRSSSNPIGLWTRTTMPLLFHSICLVCCKCIGPITADSWEESNNFPRRVKNQRWQDDCSSPRPHTSPQFYAPFLFHCWKVLNPNFTCWNPGQKQISEETKTRNQGGDDTEKDKEEKNLLSAASTPRKAISSRLKLNSRNCVLMQLLPISDPLPVSAFPEGHWIGLMKKAANG